MCFSKETVRVESDIRCGVCHERMYTWWTLPCNHTYHPNCYLASMVEIGKRCPLCNRFVDIRLVLEMETV